MNQMTGKVEILPPDDLLPTSGRINLDSYYSRKECAALLRLPQPLFNAWALDRGLTITKIKSKDFVLGADLLRAQQNAA
ncbi:hypothetical protein CLV78_10212 [Aliiruegeria haliotis]|uniref:Uncharacterized protein n=1 Tax=Aliiruegeria haliotis TaxID=1280846 RepID=A0A2T0RUN9_9RHOB|nr:hypothetical protein [Aliiruegeria haliotis]PRY24842.1 hypothetical protein CLV78_10212 [Aliiruegeria haliotis]